jgi:hypothetical protein
MIHMRWLLVLLLAKSLYAQDSVPPGRVEDFASRFTTQSALVDWRGASYVELTLNKDSLWYKTSSLSLEKIASEVFRARMVLPILVFGQSVDTAAGVAGLAIKAEALSVDASGKSAKPLELKAYVTLRVAMQFANRELTTEELADSSIVFGDDNPIAVDLSDHR